MSNSKRYQRWVSELIGILQTDFDLIVEVDRKNKHRVVRGTINGKPYYQTFSSTPKSFTSASQNVIKETKQKLLRCGIEVKSIERTQFKVAFSTRYQASTNTRLERLIQIFEAAQTLKDN